MQVAAFESSFVALENDHEGNRFMQVSRGTTPDRREGKSSATEIIRKKIILASTIDC